LAIGLQRSFGMEGFIMKRLMTLFFAGALAVASGTPALSQDKGVKEEVKEGAKAVGKGTKKVAKKTGSAVAKGTKKILNVGAKKTRQGASKVEEKTDNKK
jgi:hypothetical protein